MGSFITCWNDHRHPDRRHKIFGPNPFRQTSPATPIKPHQPGISERQQNGYYGKDRPHAGENATDTGFPGIFAIKYFFAPALLLLSFQKTNV